MIKIKFTELNFAGYEREYIVDVDSYNITVNQTGSYNISYVKNDERYLVTNCSYPEVIKQK